MKLTPALAQALETHHLQVQDTIMETEVRAEYLVPCNKEQTGGTKAFHCPIIDGYYTETKNPDTSAKRMKIKELLNPSGGDPLGNGNLQQKVDNFFKALQSGALLPSYYCSTLSPQDLPQRDKSVLQGMFSNPFGRKLIKTKK